VFVVVSLLTPPPAPEKVEGLTWEHPLQVILHAKKAGSPDPRIVAAVLTAVMVALYWIFR
jgi:hypothetical protein